MGAPCAVLSRCRRRLPTVCGGEVAGHGRDFVLGPQGAAPDHAVEHALPATAVLPMVLPHRWGVALKAFADEHFFSRCVGEPGRLRALRLRRRRQEQAAEKNRKNVVAEKGHLAPPRLQATLNGPRRSVNRGPYILAGWACP